MAGTIGNVQSGGGARGAHEFGGMEVLAPVLDEPARVTGGTSPGGLGAAYLAANAQHRVETAARSGREKGLEIEVGDVIGHPCSPRELARLPATSAICGAYELQSQIDVDKGKAVQYLPGAQKPDEHAFRARCGRALPVSSPIQLPWRRPVGAPRPTTGWDTRAGTFLDGLAC